MVAWSRETRGFSSVRSFSALRPMAKAVPRITKVRRSSPSTKTSEGQMLLTSTPIWVGAVTWSVYAFPMAWVVLRIIARSVYSAARPSSLSSRTRSAREPYRTKTPRLFPTRRAEGTLSDFVVVIPNPRVREPLSQFGCHPEPEGVRDPYRNQDRLGLLAKTLSLPDATKIAQNSLLTIPQL